MTAAEMIDRTGGASSSLGKIIVTCPKHNGREVELYCDTCGKTICLECVMRGSKHHSHEYKKIYEAYKQYQEEITSSLKSLKEKLKIITKALEDISKRNDEINSQQETIRDNIHKTISGLHETLKVREDELIDQLDQFTQAKLKSLTAQSDKITIIEKQLKDSIKSLEENKTINNHIDALSMKNKVKAKEVSILLQPDMLKPNTEADLIFTVLKDLNVECQNYGEIHHAGPDPSKCKITGQNDRVEVGERNTVNLEILNSNSQLCKASMSCTFEYETAGHCEESLKAKGKCQYTISFKFAKKGRHQLHIKVEGEHIRGSPFPVSVWSPVEKLGTSIRTIGGVRTPSGVTVSQRGEVVVTEKRGHSVTVFSPSGKKLQSFGTLGTGQGQFKYPIGVAIDAEGNILVTDSSNHRIQKFTAQGKYLTAVGCKGSGPLQFQNPLGIAVSASNSKVYIVDHNNCRIQTLNFDLTYFGTFGQRGSGEGQFRDPQHVACDSTGNVYVVDRGNYRIQVFTANGEFLRIFGSRLEPIWPYGIAIDSSDRVYISEKHRRRVSVFTSECHLLTSFASNACYSLAVDSSGVVYVCDESNNRIQLF